MPLSSLDGSQQLSSVLDFAITLRKKRKEKWIEILLVYQVKTTKTTRKGGGKQLMVSRQKQQFWKRGGNSFLIILFASSRTSSNIIIDIASLLLIGEEEEEEVINCFFIYCWLSVSEIRDKGEGKKKKYEKAICVFDCLFVPFWTFRLVHIYWCSSLLFLFYFLYLRESIFMF